MSAIKPRRFSGTRDFLPSDMIPREALFNKVKEVFALFGYDPLETPAIEYMTVLSGKYGDEADKLVYRMDYKVGTKDAIGLRYDLTVPLSRVIAMNVNELNMPFRRYQMQPVWRAERPQIRQGRYREFYQCDADCIGSKSPTTDAEIVAMIYTILASLGLPDAVVKVNNRKILRAMIEKVGISLEREFAVLRCIDKFDKIGESGVKTELLKADFSADEVGRVMSLFSSAAEAEDSLAYLAGELSEDDLGIEGVEETRVMLSYCKTLGVPFPGCVVFDPFMVRGLDYYTGPIFEAVLPSLPHMGSLAGGGRYDALIGMFSGVDVPAVGTTIGLDRIFTALEQLQIVTPKVTRAEVISAVFNAEMQEASLEVAGVLRAGGLNVAQYPDPDKLKKQFRYAANLGARFVVLVGPDEKEQGVVTLKDLTLSKQELVPVGKIVDVIKEKLG